MSNITIDPYKFGVDCSANVISCSNKAFEFDGTDDWLKINDHDDFSFDAVNNGSDVNLAHSISVYLKRDSVTANEAIYCKGNGTSSLEYRIFFMGDDLYCDTYNGSVSNYSRRSFSNLSISNGTWFHLAIAFGTGHQEVSAWVDGVDVGTGVGGSSSGDMTNTTTMFKIGDMPQGGAEWHYGGLMMQFMLWKDHKLTQAEVDYLYDNGNSLRNPTIDCGDYQVSNKLKLWIKMEDGADASGNSHDTILKGGISHTTTGDSPC